jgi:hypothetical protein
VATTNKAEGTSAAEDHYVPLTWLGRVPRLVS